MNDSSFNALGFMILLHVMIFIHFSILTLLLWLLLYEREGEKRPPFGDGGRKVGVRVGGQGGGEDSEDVSFDPGISFLKSKLYLLLLSVGSMLCFCCFLFLLPLGSLCIFFSLLLALLLLPFSCISL